MFISTASITAGNQLSYDTAVESSSKLCADRNISKVFRVGRVICLRGEINQKLKDDFFKLSPHRDDIIVSSGPGGDIAAAMDIGDFIYENNVLVIIDDLCGSSCAYFIALGGRQLALYDSGLLGFHGGPIPKKDIMKIQNITKNDRKKIIYDNKRFKNFFDKRGLQIRITNEIPDSMMDGETDWKSNMWVRWPEELKSFGFNGVVFCSGKYCKKNEI